MDPNTVHLARYKSCFNCHSCVQKVNVLSFVPYIFLKSRSNLSSIGLSLMCFAFVCGLICLVSVDHKSAATASYCRNIMIILEIWMDLKKKSEHKQRSKNSLLHFEMYHIASVVGMSIVDGVLKAVRRSKFDASGMLA